ncbi:MAG: phosphoribosyltransferase [Thermodesulfobacteriota bacterium]
MEQKRERYKDRVEAGTALARELAQYREERPVAVGLPRGGVVVAAEVAKALGCDLDVIIAGKLRAPLNPELAIGAVTEDGSVYLNRQSADYLHISEEYIEEEKALRFSAIKERCEKYRAVKKKVPLEARTVILVDDGLATGSTMISAVQAAAASGASKIVVAVPGGPRDTVDNIAGMDEVSAVVCPVIPTLFFAVSQIYIDFHQVEDSEVIKILRGFSRRGG